MNKVQFGFSEPLNEGDTENTTLGCRHTNPDICGSNSIPGLCAFESEDGICRKPSRAWKKRYNQLMNSNGKAEA
ncbi:hypothetical protein [Roseburia sp. 499]|uniref:hypothetical protein n=1 Tax=Roseburia sp. 499 TaxID=1261634 RepID=UPI00095234E4|nr:hypothetical protein [Roseburia sp. 499]WVK70243.1 hypothetical protein BIV20_01565 [Roseburia sp. 499]